MGFITAERVQRDIIGFSIDDFVEEDSKCRYIVRLIDKLDLKDLYSNYKGQGAASYDPKIMLAIWFLAYSEGISSSREIEKLCHKHLDFIYISANLRPDHTTLCRFMQRNGDLWPKYFTQIVELGKKMHISDFKEVMIDGTKMKAKSSRKQSMRERKINRYMEAVKKDIEEYKAKLSLMEKEEVPNKEYAEKEDLQKLKKKLERLEKTEKLLVAGKDELVKRKESLRPKDRENHQINLQEHDAMMMDHSLGQGYHPGYNAQITVDSKTQFIVSCSLTQDRNDQRQFSLMHEMTEETLGSNKNRVYGADSGYNTFDQLEYMSINEVNAYVRDPMLKNLKREALPELIRSKRKLYHIDFIYDKDSDSYTCPAGEKLFSSGSKSEKVSSEKSSSSKRKKYGRKDCQGCPLFSQCLGENSKKKGKEIEGDIREYLAEAMRLKMMSPEAEEIMMKRQTTVEPVFGYIKETLGFRRFRRKGLRNAAREFAFICMAVNINKLFRLHGSFKGLSSTIFIILFTLKALLDDLRERLSNQGRISSDYHIIYNEPFYAQAFC
ncbi:MAG: IS1182 family transposase [Ignavibacteria bacterium]|jgi:transposase|nr:IS1182 family transposase [Ignavibacteria bacterium]